MTQQQLLIVLAVLAGIGVLALVGHTRRVAQRTAWRVADLTHATGGLARTLSAAAVVTGMEWVTATHVQDWRLLAVLALPALLAAATLTRRRIHLGVPGRRRRR